MGRANNGERPTAVRFRDRGPRRAPALRWLLMLAATWLVPVRTRGGEGTVDLARAVLVVAGDASKVESKAATMLVEEVERRSRVRWKIVHSWPLEPDAVVVAVGRESFIKSLMRPGPSGARLPGAEGYRIHVAEDGRAVVAAGADARGVLFACGRLLRELRMAPGRVAISGGFRVTTSPRYPLRGHQLGYRPKTNSYDGWDLAQWDTYIRDLAIFGTNAIELVPPRSDDDADSPHFPRPPLEMMTGMSRLADDYGMDVWVWYPALDADYSDPKLVEFALREWAEIFQKLPRIDAIFVPGGDPGHTRPRTLLALLERQAESLHRYHPKAQMWVSPQGFTQEWLDEFEEAFRDQPAWLAGVVHGPQVRITIPELRKRVPAKYPLRLYPDITHSLSCQFPVPDWDLAFALTQGREGINPRPLGQAAIFHAYEREAIGFITYSEGCNDDVNKFVWSGLGWDPERPVVETLREYGRYFIGGSYAEGFARGLLALEANWQGPLLTNDGVETTLRQFQDMERSASPELLRNWRFQQALYRAYFDAHVRDRLVYETALEGRARDVLRRAGKLGAVTALEQARSILHRAVTEPVSEDRRARVHELAEALFHSIRMQLSVARYKAIASGRGANLDTIDAALNNRDWLESQFDEIRQVEREDGRLKAIEALLNRADPGPGGFYDDLGNPTQSPHLVRGAAYGDDPDFRRSSLVGFASRPGWPMSWCRYAQSLYDAPLELRYDRLDPTAHYAVRIVYSGDNFLPRVRLEADGQEVHPLLKKPEPVRPVEFELSRTATADGTLTLRWTEEPGRGGNGRGCQVAEVWLIRKPD
ncbi:MAG: hypothetical protein P4L84_17900 [Isosphaeraceae bacterium]|nr:hypothetical protein [Isosphaeraceae bacterium]